MHHDFELNPQVNNDVHSVLSALNSSATRSYFGRMRNVRFTTRSGCSSSAVAWTTPKQRCCAGLF